MRHVLVTMGTAGLVVLTGACSGNSAGEREPAAEAEEVTARGTVRRLGSDVSVRTVVQGEETVVVVGDYEAEIARLEGAEVWIGGRPAESPDGRALTVSEYRILAVDGEVPTVGVLSEDADGFYLRRENESPLRVDVSDRLAGAVGAKVWVVLGADGVTVSRYGVLRP